MAFKLQPPPNWCQAHKTGGPGVLAFGSQFARGLSPGERRLFDGIQMPFVPGTFWGCSWSDPLRAWRLGKKPPRGVPSPPRGSLGLTQRRKDRWRDEGLSPSFFEGWIDDCRVMIVDF